MSEWYGNTTKTDEAALWISVVSSERKGSELSHSDLTIQSKHTTSTGELLLVVLVAVL